MTATLNPTPYTLQPTIIASAACDEEEKETSCACADSHAQHLCPSINIMR